MMRSTLSLARRSGYGSGIGIARTRAGAITAARATAAPKVASRQSSSSSNSTHLPGYPSSPFLSSLTDSIFDAVRTSTSPANNKSNSSIPTFRLLDSHGELLPGVSEKSLGLTQEEAVKMYEHMLLLPALDVILYNAQRQGRISFMMTSHGEEAAIIGSASGLGSRDEVFAQYREMGVLLWRGFTLDQVMSQVFGAHDDLGMARQMPIHFGSTEHHFHTISSPLATQIPQAAGSGYALKRTKGREEDVAVCFFGEGAASEGDAHAGMNMAATLKCPVLFIVRNNGFAISTPSSEQYASDGIAARGPAYGISTIRVDGNDVLAVRSAIRHARQVASTEKRPFLIECMTYRVGHHSTSDDSSAYRSKQDVDDWKRKDNPLHRFRHFLQQRGWWDDQRDEATRAEYRKRIIRALETAEKKKRPSLSSIFDDTYDELPQNLKEQREDLARLLDKYGKDYEPWAKELGKYKDEGEDMRPYVPSSSSSS